MTESHFSYSKPLTFLKVYWNISKIGTKHFLFMNIYIMLIIKACEIGLTICSSFRNMSWNQIKHCSVTTTGSSRKFKNIKIIVNNGGKKFWHNKRKKSHFCKSTFYANLKACKLSQQTQVKNCLCATNGKSSQKKSVLFANHHGMRIRSVQKRLR